jgi:alpha-L-fucosidase
MLADIVSRNGNLLLNFPLPSSGMLDSKELAILDEITKWMAVNSEAIYSTRPWKTFGEGPAVSPASGAGGTSEHHQAGAFNERNRKPLTGADIRFTKKGDVLYALCMGWPDGEARIAALANSPKVRNVEMLGLKDKLSWKQEASGLTVRMPAARPSDHAVVLKIYGV